MRFILRWTLRLLLLWMVFACGVWSAIFLYGRVDRAEAADVIIVLGAGLRPDGRPGPALIRRSAQAINVWENGLAEAIICAGGVPYRANRSEAAGCRDLLLAAGIPDEHIFLEENSHSTEENALYSAEIMQANGWHSAIVVSDAYHLLRANWLFNQQGIPNVTSPAADPPFDNHLTFSLREVAALHWQVFKQVLGLPFTYVPLL